MAASSNPAGEAKWMSNYCIAWIDNNIGHFSNKKKIKLLIEMDPNVKTFDNEDDGAKYLRKQNKEKQPTTHMTIVSGALSETIIPRIENYQCVFGIFIYCRDADAYRLLKFDKLVGVYTDFDELLEAIDISAAKLNETTCVKFFVQQKHESTNPISAIVKSEPQRAIRNLQENQADFIWYFQMQEFMINLDNDDDEEAKQVMIEQSRLQYNENKNKIGKIEEYKTRSLKENKVNAVADYTHNSFIYECVNNVLRKENISQVYCFRFIIKLISQQLRALHQEFIKNYRAQYGEKSLRVYRGYCMEPDQIESLLNSAGNLISLNGFVSTSKRKSVALQFINRRFQKDFIPILFKITIDMANDHSVAFADISHISRFPLEEEVLLSIGTVFHVDSIEKTIYENDLDMYIVHLSLKQHNQLVVIKYIESTYGKNVDKADKPVLFGKLIFEMGEPEAAVTYFRDALQRLSDRNNHYRPIFLNNIGVCYNELKKHTKALEYHKKALEIYKTTGNKSARIACQLNIASVYHAQGEHEQARKLAEEILFMNEANRLEKASCYNLIGCIYLSTGNNDAAYSNFLEALEIRSKYYDKTDPDHPEIGVSHHNVGKACTKLCNFVEARTHYQKAEKIYRRNYADNHPLVIEISQTLMRSR